MPDIPKPQPRRATVRQLASRIKGTGENPLPRFCFFLGAGASFESGIPLAGAMIADFSQRIIDDQCPEEFGTPEKQRAWLQSQSWYVEAKQQGSLYSTLFEMHEQKVRGRQRYIEQMIEGRKPSFGYVVLAHLMARNYINTVLTTNFDDLVYNGCSTFTDIRPVVYAYGTMVSDLRITNARPKILKLHGDYLYSRLKNSNDELAHQDPNMARYVSMLLNEYGLVVIGYSGCDDSIMEMLRNFPPDNDLYWCVRAGSSLPESVRSLLVEIGGFVVEIESFDRMMNEVRSIIQFDVPKMLGSLEARQDEMIRQLKSFPARSLAGYSALLREIYDFRLKDLAERQQKEQKEEGFLHYVNGWDALQNGEFARAESEFRASLSRDPEDVNARISLGGVLTQEGKFKEAEDELTKAKPNAQGENLVQVVFQLAYLNMVQGRTEDSLGNYNEVIRLAPQNAVAYNGAGIAWMKLGRLDEAEAELRKSVGLDPSTYYASFNLATVLTMKGDTAESRKWWLNAGAQWQLRDNIDPYNHAVIQACLGNSDKAIDEMRAAIQRGQPGLARLAHDSVVLLDQRRTDPTIHKLREMLEQAMG